MKKTAFLLISLLTLTSCGNKPFHASDMLGADALIMDSYAERKKHPAFFSQKSTRNLTADDFVSKGDVITDGDVLLLHVLDADRMTKAQEYVRHEGYVVKDGTIRLDNEHVLHVGELSLNDAAKKIQEALKASIGYNSIRLLYKLRPHSSVVITGHAAIHEIPIDGSTSLYDVLAKATLTPTANLFKSYVIRDNQKLACDLEALIHDGDMSYNIIMRPNDKIHIASELDSTVMVMGEVKREGLIPVKGRGIPLKTVLARSGGMLMTADRLYIQVFRSQENRPKIYTVQWNQLMRVSNDSMLVLPGDVIYIAATPISRWNVFVNQLLPSVSTYEIFNKGTSGVLISP